MISCCILYYNIALENEEIKLLKFLVFSVLFDIDLKF